MIGMDDHPTFSPFKFFLKERSVRQQQHINAESGLDFESWQSGILELDYAISIQRETE